MREIEAASFVPARLLLRVAAAAVVVRHSTTLSGLMAMVLNRRESEAALVAGSRKRAVHGPPAEN